MFVGGSCVGWITVNKGEAVEDSHMSVSFMAGLEWRVFRSSCLPKKFRGEWSFGGLTYQVSGDPDGKETI